MKRILFVATVASHIRAFHLPMIDLLTEKGYQVEIACYPDTQIDGSYHVWPLPFCRNPYSWRNISAILRLKGLITDHPYDLIHVHTPVAAFLVRLAARNMDTPILYTAHGFHFYKGAPLRNRLIYRTAERLAANWTAGLIVMNQEDLQAAQGLGFKPGENLYSVHGVGVDLDFYGHPGEIGQPVDGRQDTPVVLCIGEFTPNKNQSFLIEAWKYVVTEIPGAQLWLAGRGKCEKALKDKVSREHLSSSVHFLGYRPDIPALISRANVVAMASKREGLPRSIMEAMAGRKPVVASNIRGNRDLIRDGINGFLFPLHDMNALVQALMRVLTDAKMALKMGNAGYQMVQEYALAKVLDEVWNIYQKHL